MGLQLTSRHANSEGAKRCPESVQRFRLLCRADQQDPGPARRDPTADKTSSPLGALGTAGNQASLQPHRKGAESVRMHYCAIYRVAIADAVG